MDTGGGDFDFVYDERERGRGMLFLITLPGLGRRFDNAAALLMILSLRADVLLFTLAFSNLALRRARVNFALGIPIVKSLDLRGIIAALSSSSSLGSVPLLYPKGEEGELKLGSFDGAVGVGVV